jgi:hypothetical protein
MRLAASFLAALLAASACGAATKVAAPPAETVPAPATQVQVSDDESDPCEERGRYGDGVCDEMCPEVDPDCDPRVALTSPPPARR